MDSLTQLALGAAVGEAAMGKKLGNRAMVWGAFGGLLPDFDVMAMFFTDEMNALAFHRGFLHSFVFSVMASLALGWLVHRLYDSGFYQTAFYKGLVSAFVLGIYTLLGLGLHMILKEAVETPFWIGLFVAIGVGIALLLWLRYIRKELRPVSLSVRNWVWLFFLAIFTHPLLDNFTAFGTQIFQPFSDFRVSFSNISVVDPLYTIWLLLGIGLAAFLRRQNKWRRWVNWAGLALSSVYMVFTLYHKVQVDRIFEASLKEQGINYTRYTTSPTILTNYLWNGLAEGDTAFYHAQYSLFDKEATFPKVHVLPKGQKLISGHDDDRTMKILRWFSNGYLNVIPRSDGKLQLNDLRFGSFDGKFDAEDKYIFRFILEEKDGELEAHQERGGREINKEVLDKYFRRVFGYRE